MNAVLLKILAVVEKELNVKYTDNIYLELVENSMAIARQIIKEESSKFYMLQETDENPKHLVYVVRDDG